MIGGRVLDTSALLAFATETSVYCSALVWTAVRESMVLAVPSTAVAAAWADLADRERARAVGLLGGPQADAHAVACARERGWPLVTAQPARYAEYGHANINIELLP